MVSSIKYGDWGTYPTSFLLNLILLFLMSLLSIFISPEVFSSNPIIMSTSVVLPEPDLPCIPIE